MPLIFIFSNFASFGPKSKTASLVFSGAEIPSLMFLTIPLNLSLSCHAKNNNEIKGYAKRTGNCANCNTLTQSSGADAKKSKTGNIFCNSSCAASYNNKHKKHGTRKSKLEIFILQKIQLAFPDLKVLPNDRTLIGYELDFYFPELRFAIELNGIFHYEPIYGADKLTKIQFNDKQKILNCFEKNVECCVIDTSHIKHLNKNAKDFYEHLIVEQILRPIVSRKWSG